MATARHSEPPSLAHRILNGRYHLVGRADQTDVLRVRPKSLIETLVDDDVIPRIVGTDVDGFDPRLVDCLSAGHPAALSSPSCRTSGRYRGSFLIGSSRGCTRSRSKPGDRSSMAMSSQRNASSTSPRLAWITAIPHDETT